MSRLSLYAIADELAAIVADNDDGELSPDCEARLAALDMALEEKSDNICKFIRELQASAEGYGAEEKRLADLKRAALNKADRLKRYLKDNLETAGIQRLDTALFRLSVCRNGQPSVRIADGFDVPAEFQKIRVELDSKKVAEAFRAGWPMPAGVTCEIGNHLRIG